MSVPSALNRLDKRYAWSLLGFVLAIVFGLLSLYTEFWRDRRPQVRFEVVSDASVLDVREKLGNLEVIYDGVDIQKARRSLRVIVVRITNEGPEDILKTFYDEGMPFGFRVVGGTLIRAEVLASSSDYLRSALSHVRQDADSAVFPPVILEAGEWFTVKSLILHSETIRPTIQPIGKIAGVRKIRRSDSTEAAAEPGFWSLAFSGKPWVQVARLPGYFFGFILVIVCIVVPVATASSVLSKRRRRQHVARFKSMTKIQLLDADEFIFERYVENDLPYLEQLQRAGEDQSRLDHQVKRLERQKHRRKQRPPALDEAEQMLLANQHGRLISERPMRMPIRDMLKTGFIIKGDQGWQVDPHLKQTLDEFVRFVEIRRAT